MAAGKTRDVGRPASLKDSFPTPRDAVAYIMDTFPIAGALRILNVGMTPIRP